MTTLYSAVLDRLLEPVLDAMRDPFVTDVLINGPFEVYIERKGLLELLDRRFEDDEHLVATARALAQFVGKRLEPAGCRIDGRLPNGSRVHILHGPASDHGTLISIRSFPPTTPTIDELVTRGSLTPEAAAYLRAVVALEKNIVVAGATGSGKSTMLGALAGLVDGRERVIVLEDARELRIPLPHVISLEARPPDESGMGGMTIRDLLHSCMRLRPGRLIVGEVRGAEALDLLTALTSGHGGSFSTIHALSAETVIARLVDLCLMALPSLSPLVLERQIRSAIQLVVHVARTHEGTRRVSAISEVDPEGVRPIFAIARGGPERGQLVWTGAASAYQDEALIAGLTPDARPFTPRP